MPTTSAATVQIPIDVPPFQVGDTVSHRGISITPLFPRHDPVAEYIGPELATRLGLHITEDGPDGDVPWLAISNPTPHRVLIPAGTELLGGNQDRITDRTTLIEPCARERIPVSCIEPGRWSPDTDRFTIAPHHGHPSLRRAIARCTEADDEPGAAQVDVWLEIEAQLARFQGRSVTGSHRTVFRRRRTDLERLAVEFPAEPGQCGMVLGLWGDPVCLDAVSRPEVFAEIHPALLAGCLLQALTNLGRVPTPQSVISVFTDHVLTASRDHRQPVCGGTSRSLRAYGITGQAHQLGDELIHITAFSGPPLE